MKQITIRGIPEEIEKIIKKEAKRKGLSLNKTFILMLEQIAGLNVSEKRKEHSYHDLDKFFGIWKNEDFSEFSSNLEHQRKIDETLWKKIE